MPGYGNLNMHNREIVEYAAVHNIQSRFYIILVDIGNKQTIGELLGGDSNKEIPKFYYAIKDIATGQIVSTIEENLKDAYEHLNNLRDLHGEEKCCILFFEHLEVIKNLQKELKYA